MPLNREFMKSYSLFSKKLKVIFLPDSQMSLVLIFKEFNVLFTENVMSTVQSMSVHLNSI